MHLTTTVCILGSGGFAKELQCYLQEELNMRSIFIDDSNPNESISIAQYHDLMAKYGSCASIMGTGRPHIKNKMSSEIKEPYFTFIHPRAILNGRPQIMPGTVIAPGVVIAPYTIIGKHVLCNYNCTIGHNSIIGDMSVIGPNASIGGFCELGERVYVGAGACIKENVKIGNGSVVGMGAVVLKEVPPNVTVIGVPAKIMEK